MRDGMPEWLHQVDDRRGPRQVFLDGEPVNQVIFADTKHGFLIKNAEPLRAEGELVVREVLEGKVTVEFL